MCAAAVDGNDTSKFLQLAQPDPAVSYPLEMMYCGECGLPPEYCEYGPHAERCLKWLESNLPDLFEQLTAASGEDGATGDDAEKKKRQTRGGKASTGKKKKEVKKRITVSRASRGKKKFVTVVTGLTSYDIDLKAANKFFGQRFATGSSATGAGDEIVIQGDCKDELIDLLSEKWPEIDPNTIEDLGEQKR